MSAERELNTSTVDDDKLVRPKVEFQTLLRHAGATKDVFTMKEVMFYLGQYIIQKQLYDQKQQHIVHCSQDALGQVLGVDSFSVKETRVLFAMITKNLVAVKSQETSQSLDESQSNSQTERGTEEADSESRSSSPDRRRRRRRRRRSRRNSDPGPSRSFEDDEDEEETEDEDDDGGRKRRRSDSYSLTFDNSLSWCVIGGLGSGRDRHSSQSSDSHSSSARSEVTVAASDSDSDNFSVEFEVESVDSDDYNEDDASLSADDQVYEVTIYEEDDEDSFDEDTEITEADYWRCVECSELNPPLPRHCLRCWTLQQDWLPKDPSKSACSSPKALPLKPTDQSAAKEASGSDAEDNEGVDVPDGKRARTPPVLSPCLSDSASSAPNSQDLLSCSQPSSSASQQKLWASDSQPSDSQPSSSSSIDSQELLPSSPPPSQPPVPELDRSVSAEWRLPDSCLDPCLICQSRPKNGCIVHGRTGHLMSCYECARKLKKRNKLCPVCRLPIQSVILTYIS